MAGGWRRDSGEILRFAQNDKLWAVLAFLFLLPATSFAAGSAWLRVLTLQDYNTRVVMLGAALLGMSGGIVGSFMLLRKRSLLADAVSHATLPGIAAAFLFMAAAGADGKSLPVLLLGAFVSGLIGMGLVLVIRSQTRLKEDVALGIVLSVFFGIGIALLGVIQKMSTGHAAGLESFIYGKTASMLASDAWLIGGAGLVVVVLCGLLFKEFGLLCFDPGYAKSQGWPVGLLDVVLMGMVVFVTVIGLQAVGLILVIALLIIPPAAARFWTHNLLRMVIVAALFGAAGCLLGAACSALLPRLPAGAVIVTTIGLLFLASMIFAPERGVLARQLEHWRLSRRVAEQNLLRAAFEWNEKQPGPVPLRHLVEVRSWPASALRRLLRTAGRDGFLTNGAGGGVELTERGRAEAQRLVRNHRLWELYLITHADIAPSHVDRDADQIEHVLGRSMVQELEEILASQMMPASPHPIGKEPRA